MSLFKKFSKIQIWIMGVLFFVLGTAHLKALENVENLWSARIPISLEGTIRPIEIIREQTSVGGRITAITVEENDEVQKNQLLLSLKNDTQKQQLEIARLQQKINKNNLRDREQQISLTKVQIDMSKNSLMVQETNLKDIRRRLKDEQTLFEQGSSTKSQLDAIQLELDRGMLSLSNAELNLLKSKQDSTRAQLGKENTALTLKLSEQDVILKKDNLNDTMIRSKISGIVIKKYFEEGEVVGNGARLFDIVNIDRVEIEVGVKEEDLSGIQIGQKVVFTTPAYPNQRFAGKVDRLSWTANTQDGKFPVFIHAANPNLKLRSGMSAKVYMVSAE
jgi:multidrug resistance efflux pump